MVDFRNLSCCFLYRSNLIAHGGVLVPVETIDNINGANMIDDLAFFQPKSLGGNAPDDPFDANNHKDCVKLSELTAKPSLQPSSSGVRHRGGMQSMHKRGSLNSYTQYLPLYENNMKLVPNEGPHRGAAHDIVSRHLNRMQQELYALNLGDNNRLSSNIAPTGQLSSLPNIETAPMRKNLGNLKR